MSRDEFSDSSVVKLPFASTAVQGGSMNQYKAEVIVVGGGLSGLSAAKLLREQGVDVVVLEARDRVGGRTFTIQNDKVRYVDLGGAYVGPTQNRLLRLAREFGVKTFLTNEVEDLAFFSRGSMKRFRGTFPPMGGLLSWLDMNNLFRTIDQLGEEIPLDAPWTAPHAAEWDSMTMQQFFDKHCWTRAANSFGREFIEVNVTSEPYEVSALWFLWYVKGAGGSFRIFGTTNGGQERKFVGGSQQISIKMAEKIGNDRVLLNHPVSKIEHKPSEVVVQDVNGNRYTAKYAIIAAPLPIQNKIIYDPPLPSLRNQLLQRAPMGSVIKTFMYYSTPFWRRKGLCGSSAIDDKDGLVGFTLDHVMPDGSHPALMGFILADKARRYVELTPDERKSRIAHLYSKVFQTDEALHPVHYEEKDWLGEQWSGGCYTTMMPPGFLTKFGSYLRRPIGRMYFAGTETATQWSGYMDGAVQAGERAAREILHTMGKIRADQIWQAEPEDMEVKARPFDVSFWESNAPSVPGLLKLLGFTSLLSAAGAGGFVYYKYLR
ncbi:amine oxidase [flavin-containing]-like isoform X2 [Haliotis rufescens]|uniref:amine oxidase [flavin-containing]-like isoform X2 n=1 Tax=Haliotis rufescens TaxID=6454 RepID=UPI001EAFE54E|nr:amine oxidase [flavin-containing]-like isoform X2 [Haliotis rufescens]